MIARAGRLVSAGMLAAGALLLAPSAAWAVVPPDFSVTVTDETGEPIPDVSITLDIPRKAGKKPRTVTRDLPRKPRRSQIDRTGRVVKKPPRRRDTTATFRVPRDADCSRPLRITVKMGRRVIGGQSYAGWCDDKDRNVKLTLAPTPFFSRDAGGSSEAEED